MGRSRLSPHLAFSPDGKYLVQQNESGVLHFRDAITGKRIRPRLELPDYILAMKFSPNGKTLIANTSDGQSGLFDPLTGQQLGSWQPPPKDFVLRDFRPHRDWYSGTTLTTDGTKVAQADAKEVLHVWETATGKACCRIADPPSSDTKAIFSPDGRFLALDHKDKLVRLWDTTTGKLAYAFPNDGGGHCHIFAFSPDGRLLASASRDHTALVWDVTGMCPDGKWRSRAAMPVQMERLWTDLADDDSVRAYRAVWTMAVAGRQSVPFLAQHFRPVPRPAEERLARLIADLDSDRFETRRRASKELEAMAELAEPALRKALADKPSLEVRRRLRALLEPLEKGTLSSEQLRDLRAVEVLEQIGTPEARQVLEALAKGAPAVPRTREAKASLERLDKRHALKP